MYFQDHEPPHFHATYGGAEARVRISPMGLLDGDIPPRPWRRPCSGLRHEAELLENWSRLRLKQSPVKIAPLE